MTQVPIEYQLKPFILLILLVNIVSLSIIYRKTNENIANKREVIAFKGMLISFMVYSLVDLRLLIGDAFYTTLPRLFVLFVISVDFATMSFACFFWFLHVYATLNLTKLYNRRRMTESLEKNNTLPYMPLFSMGAVRCTSPQTELEKVLKQADDILYMDKEEHHKESESFINKLKSIKNGTV